MKITTRKRDVTICAVPYELSIVDGGAMFSDKSGFYGVTGRFMFAYKSGLWYLTDAQKTFNDVALCHLSAMHKQLATHFGADHELGDYCPNLAFKPSDDHCPTCGYKWIPHNRCFTCEGTE